ncbi:glycosyltransferase [Sporosarcina sp. PTS2304]|uniref:glycosyltransferase family 2 protein n=1 Tax=Sporosarcina sp. PTS2304 TaxID=2283194 RepID=UPI000E0CD4FE|nr:glycosyltransferase family 2 protein [Sporosarcina sp. PTS2304]AXH98438.1 glycosyltransferase [Sporosarcina sp. PTS2304]
MKLAGPKITIITACYNSEDTIEQTIQSVLSQTYENIEYIIVDGASTDGTMDIVEKYRDRIDVVVSEKDRGVYDAFNKGVELATGEYIIFLNSDDYFYKTDVMEKCSDFIVSHEYPIGIYGDIFILNEETGFVDRYSREISIDEMKKGFMPPHPATLLKRNVIKEYGGFDLQYRIAADFDLISKLFLNYEEDILHIERVLTNFRLGGLSSHIDTMHITKSETNQILHQHFPGNEINYGPPALHNNEYYLMKWVEMIIHHKKSIGAILKSKQVNSVAIFGSGEMAVLIATDLQAYDIKVVGYLDNDINRQGIVMNNSEVFSPKWLIENLNSVDLVLYGFQGNHDKDIDAQLALLLGENRKIPCLSWREIISQ